MAWLVLPQFKGAAFLYEKFVREKLIKRRHQDKSKSKSTAASSNGKPRNKFVDFISPKKVSLNLIGIN